MPQHIYLGKKNRNFIQDDTYIETKVTFQDLVINPKVNLIKLSDSQRDLNEDKVSQSECLCISVHLFLCQKKKDSLLKAMAAIEKSMWLFIRQQDNQIGVLTVLF